MPFRLDGPNPFAVLTFDNLNRSGFLNCLEGVERERAHQIRKEFGHLLTDLQMRVAWWLSWAASA
jgi:hypothetical protein